MSQRVRHFDKQNKAHGYAPNKKMNDDTYALRRKVIEVIYEAKKRVELPRIDVRITEPNKGSHSGILGLAYLGLNMVYIPSHLIEKGRLKPFFKEVVLHEIVHAVTGFEHDAKCPLMAPSIGCKPMSEAEMWKAFEKYFQ
jgi:hypothetical protein